MEPKKISDNVTLYSADPIVYVVNNFLSDDAFNRIHAFISTIPKLNFNNIDCNKVFECIKYDKKKRKNKFNFIVLTDIGKADIFYKITSDDFKEAINYIANHEYSCN